MSTKIKNQCKYKCAGILLYFIFSLAGLTILFIFPPKDLLFDNTEIDEIKQKLFKDFIKIVYDNINAGIIKNMTFTEENVPCPSGFDTLNIENQYHGYFSKFYGNNSFCIQRYNYTYEKLLLDAREVCDSGKHSCGKINRESNLFLCLDEPCPLYKIDFDSKSGRAYKYKLPNENIYFIPFYGDEENEENKPPIVDIVIINNERLCLEKFFIDKEKNCEFFDNNECFIHVGFEGIRNLIISNNIDLYSSNLARFNLKNDENINHNFCSNFLFHIFTMNYFNFTYEKLQDFKTEFPFKDKTNNSLYKTYDAYKSHYNIDVFFYVIGAILLCISFFHFIILIILYCEKYDLRNLYIINGIFLFAIKLISLFCMISYHFWFYLKIKKVYAILIDRPLKELIDVYNSTRKSFISKIISLWIVGIIIIIIDLVIFIFSVTVNWGNLKLSRNEEENNKEIDNTRSNMIEERINVGERIDTKMKEEVNRIDTTSFINKPDSLSKEEIDFNGVKIEIEFIFISNALKRYKLKVENTKLFKDVIEQLKTEFPELKEESMDVFSYGSKILNKEISIEENGIKDKGQILIAPKK